MEQKTNKRINKIILAIPVILFLCIVCCCCGALYGSTLSKNSQTLSTTTSPTPKPTTNISTSPTPQVTQSIKKISSNWLSDIIEGFFRWIYDTFIKPFVDGFTKAFKLK